MLITLLGIAATAYAQESSSDHNWSKGRTVQKATCTNEGIISYVCLDDNCDATKEEVIAPLGHNFNEEYIIDIFPSCTEEGSKSQHCTRCDIKGESISIPANGHKWGKGDTIQHASCLEEGEMVFHCSIEGCNATKQETLPAIGHQWNEGEVILAPTCTQKGTLRYNCLHDHCDAVKHEAITERGHLFANDFTIDEEATCQFSGKKSQHCTVCDERINVTILPSIGHAWGDPNIIHQATCTEPGLSVRACTHPNCEERITQEIVAIGHNFPTEYTIDIAATCSKEGSKSRHCTHCDAHFESIVIPTLPHISGDTIIERIISPCCHNEGSQDEVAYCTACKNEIYRTTTILPALEHKWDEGRFTIYPTTSNKGKKVYTCTECQITKHEIVDKLYEEIALLKDNKGETFRVSKNGFCPGSESHISYAVAKGSPIEYKLTFSQEALNAGFIDEVWNETSTECKIAILTPENCQAGKYTAYVTFRDETGQETAPIGFTFSVRDKEFAIDEEEMENSLKRRETGIYPNPIREQANITFNNSNQEKHNIRIINEMGATLFNASFEGEETSIDCSTYTPGRYIIRVDGTTFKVIKM